MIEREVTRTRKDKDGDITALCNPGNYWSPKSKSDAIQDIESGNYNYYVKISRKGKGEYRSS